VLERRAVANIEKGGVEGLGGPLLPWEEERWQQSDAAYHVIRKIIGDAQRATGDPSIPSFPVQAPWLSPRDELPMVDLPIPADYDFTAIDSGKTPKYEIKPGNLYTVAMELMTINHHGLKAVRPALGSSKIALEIYNGADLTNVVVFDAKFDQFDDATYLLSYAGSTNRGYVFSKTGSQEVAKTADADPSGVVEPTGLDRRVLYLDISSEENTDNSEARRIRGLMELYKYNATALFDGHISEQVADSYNRDYFLGDIIRLDGEYGLSETVRVAEFIRSDDTTGSKAYPTFEVVTDV
jgi:hypothetical protein